MSERASLAMYNHPEVQGATEQFWCRIAEALRAEGIHAPTKLSKGGLGSAFWRDPDLVLSQTCGYPYRIFLKNHVNFVGTPDYGLLGCPPGHYHSVIVVHAGSPYVRANDLDRALFAYNDMESQSGFHGPLSWAHGAGVTLIPTLNTEAHSASARAVAEGKADVAGIDGVTWKLIERYDAVAKHLRVVARTNPVPGLPLICAKRFEAETIASSLSAAIDTLDMEVKEALMITGLSDLRASDYTAAAFGAS
ncbi:MAG: PhnD/SsuA/transferrin family substrate-binding protein [Pseudomonadota bacterium]